MSCIFSVSECSLFSQSKNSWDDWKGPQEIIPSNLPLKAEQAGSVSSRVLNVSRDGDSTASLDYLQCLTTFTVKKKTTNKRCFLCLNGICYISICAHVPLVLSLGRAWLHHLYFLHIKYLYTLIISPLSLLFPGWAIPKLSLLNVRCSRPFIISTAFCCPRSSVSKFLLYWGDQPSTPDMSHQSWPHSTWWQCSTYLKPTVFAARVHCLLMFSFFNTRVPRTFSAKLLFSWPLPVLLQILFPSGYRTWLFFAELYRILVSPFLLQMFRFSLIHDLLGN